MTNCTYRYIKSHILVYIFSLELIYGHLRYIFDHSPGGAHGRAPPLRGLRLRPVPQLLPAAGGDGLRGGAPAAEAAGRAGPRPAAAAAAAGRGAGGAPVARAYDQ